VVKGDTLWDISATFLEEPWRWPEIWRGNPQIKNPHLIFPGDVIRLVWKDGKAQLIVERGVTERQADTPIVKLSPQKHATAISAAIPTIPLEKIVPFLSHSYVISDNELERGAYIVSTEGGRLIAGAGNTIYARGVSAGDGDDFTILRIGRAYRNPGEKEILGYEAVFIGEANLRELNDPATLMITQSNRESLRGDRLLPRIDSSFKDHFIPHEPDIELNGQIISVLDGISRIGQYQAVVINQGVEDGVEIGHVLAVSQTGKTVTDSTMGERIKLPDERAGIIMVFRTFERVSYALVLNAYRDMRIHDMVGNP
jgi:uncharacterized protein GlcG (DUF336 family)